MAGSNLVERSRGRHTGAPALKTLARHASLRVSVLDTVRVLRVAVR